VKLTKRKLENLIQEQLDQNALEKIQAVIAKGNLPERYALYIAAYKGAYALVLYQLPPLKPEIAGFCQIFKTKKPCIPETYEIAAIARKSGKDYKGLGAVMYDLASTIVKIQHDGGITSDHGSSTSEAAYKVWNKMLNSGKYIKRKTALGKNDKFDYDNSTPRDPADDCSMPKGSDVAASDHSLQIKQNSPHLEKFMDNHEKAMKVAEEVALASGQRFMPKTIESMLEKAGMKMFADIYSGPDIKVLTKNYFSIWNKIKRAIGVKESL
jgi:hypothetical protein